MGALAVALGVSGAVATTPGVAWADEFVVRFLQFDRVGVEPDGVHFGIGRVIDVHIFRVKLVVDRADVDDFLRTLH